MNQSLEKIVIIGLNLTLLITIGLPLLITTTQVISESEQSIVFQNFVNDVDSSILLADQSGESVSVRVVVPSNVTLEAEYNQLIFKVYLDSWYIITRTYRYTIFLVGPSHSGLHLLTITPTNSSLQILFQAE
ncbi:MAG: hypothetical protein ACFFD8_00510 [Candidatus Thorarchaeota archaeon]